MNPILQKYLSYLTPIGVESFSSDINKKMEIQWVDGTKVLNTEKANFSYGSLHRIFQYGLKEFSPQLKKEDTVLILGFGAGSVYQILKKERKFTGKITGVELDEKIIKAANTHFNIPENSKQFELINTDAFLFIADTTKKYNLIVVDIFDDLTVPAKFLTSTFIQELKNKLANNGFILFNIINQTQKQQLENIIAKCNMHFITKSIRIYGCTNYLLKIYNN